MVSHPFLLVTLPIFVDYDLFFHINWEQYGQLLTVTHFINIHLTPTLASTRMGSCPRTY